MPKIKFIPQQQVFEVDPGVKILAGAVKNKIPIQYGCGSARCGTCGVKVCGSGELSEMKPPEKSLLNKMKMTLDGSIRLACQTKIMDGEVQVDLDFQQTYSPDDFLEFNDQD